MKASYRVGKLLKWEPLEKKYQTKELSNFYRISMQYDGDEEADIYNVLKEEDDYLKFLFESGNTEVKFGSKVLSVRRNCDEENVNVQVAVNIKPIINKLKKRIGEIFFSGQISDEINNKIFSNLYFIKMEYENDEDPDLFLILKEDEQKIRNLHKKGENFIYFNCKRMKYINISDKTNVVRDVAINIEPFYED